MSYVPRQYMPNMENEGEPYYEKYAVKDENTSPKSQAPYYEQYAIEEPQEKSLWEKTKDLTRYPEIAGSSIYSGLRSAPRTGFELLKSIVGATGGNLKDLEEAQETAPEWLKKFGSYVFPTYEEQQQSMQERGSPKPEGFGEKALEKLGRFVGEAPFTGGIGGAKGLASLGGLALGSQYGEEAELGPIGQLGTGLIGAATPAGINGLVKGVTNFAKNPKQALAKVAASFTKADKLALQKQLIDDARKAGVTLDIGSITDNGLIKQMQSSLAQSGYTGKALDELRETMSNQIVSGYKDLADNLGKVRFENTHHAGDVIQRAIQTEQDVARKAYRDMYSKAAERLTDESIVYPEKIVNKINEIEKQLAPGSVQSAGKKAVSSIIQDIKKDVMTSEGQIKGAKVKDLINNKIELHDIANYDVSGGVKDKLKTLAHEIDENIKQYGATDPTFVKEYKAADKAFGDYAKTFKNKNIASALRTQDPAQILNKMKDVQGIKDIQKSLSGSPEGRQLFDEMKRFKIDDMIGKNLETGSSNQIKFGTFSNVLSKGNNKAVLKELMGSKDFKKLEDLTKVSGKLAESANKFLNASQSSVRAADIGVAAKFMHDFSALFSGNPWPILKTTGTLGSAKQVSNLIADPKFLNLVEEAVLAQKSNNPSRVMNSLSKIGEYAKTTSKAIPEVEENKSPP